MSINIPCASWTFLLLIAKGKLTQPDYKNDHHIKDAAQALKNAKFEPSEQCPPVTFAKFSEDRLFFKPEIIFSDYASKA